MPGSSLRQYEHICHTKAPFNFTLILKKGKSDEDDYGGQIVSMDHLGQCFLAFSEGSGKNLKEMFPDWNLNPGPMHKSLTHIGYSILVVVLFFMLKNVTWAFSQSQKVL